MNFKELPEITERQQEIVELVYKFRFINRHQIQRYFNHKDPKRINTWLKDLVSKGYLGRIYSHKLLENTKPAIYFLSNIGILHVKYNLLDDYSQEGHLFVKKFYQDKNASQTFIDHCISIFWIYIQFKEIEKTRKDLEYSVYTKTEMWIEQKRTSQDGKFVTIKEYIPDLYIDKIKDPEKEALTSTSYFLTLFDENVPRYAIRYKVDQYMKLKNEEGEHYIYNGFDEKFPIIIFIFPNQQKLNSIRRYIQKKFDETMLDVSETTFLLTTLEKILNEGIGAKQPIWQVVNE